MVEFLMAGSFFFKDDFQAKKGNETPKISFGEIHI